jgi:hypothetical protein
MSDANPFGKFVPGFDFLQSLAKGAASNIPQLPNPANWVAPTLNVEELDKRITELKAVQFWLDQNAKALAATVTALEVQKMTLATLKGMNFNMGDVANAFKLKAADTVASTVQSAKDKVEHLADTVTGKPTTARKTSKAAAKPQAGAPGLIDPMQFWGSLTEQFGQIAAGAMKDAAKNTAIDTTKNMAKAMTSTAMRSAKSTAEQIAKSAGAAASQTLQRMGQTRDTPVKAAAPKSTATPRKTASKKIAASAGKTRTTRK